MSPSAAKALDSKPFGFLTVDEKKGTQVDHIVILEGAIGLHREVVAPWQTLVAAANKQGFDLALASAYRSFERQQQIWDAKLSGRRAVLDDQGCQLDIATLPALERVQSVMRWSALPGTSRHHWGTDMDIYDRAAVAADYKLQMVPEEYTDDGPFAPMITWLHTHLEQDNSPSFFFPYREDCGGIAPEPWHLSYRPVAERFQRLWSLSGLSQLLAQSDLCEREAVIENLDSLYERYILRSLNPE